jgi:hypothetical protein
MDGKISSRNADSFSSARTTKRFPSPRCASAIQIVRPLESIADTQPQLQRAFFRLSAIRLPTRQPICQVALNGEFGNTRDASVHADGTKSRLPKRVARALRRRNSLRKAIQLWGVARSCYGFRDCTAHPTQKEETGGTAPLSSPSHIPQVHRRNSAHTEQSAETTFLTSPSQFPPILFRGATKCWPCPQTLVFIDGGSFAAISMRERGGTKRIASLQLQAAKIASVVWQCFTRRILSLLLSTQQ